MTTPLDTLARHKRETTFTTSGGGFTRYITRQDEREHDNRINTRTRRDRSRPDEKRKRKKKRSNNRRHHTTLLDPPRVQLPLCRSMDLNALKMPPQNDVGAKIAESLEIRRITQQKR